MQGNSFDRDAWHWRLRRTAEESRNGGDGKAKAK
jgi:hypothetical protein